MGTKAQMQAYLDAQNGHVGGAKYWQYVYGWSGGGLPYCAVGVSAALKATDTECAYFPSKVAFDSRDKAEIGSAYRTRNNLEYLDAIAFDWDGDNGGDHVGFFIKYLGDGKCRTFEFNVSNTAAYRTRNVSDILCGIRPKYSDNKPRKLHVDGKFGVNTKKRVQETLQLHGFYIGPDLSPRPRILHEVVHGEARLQGHRLRSRRRLGLLHHRRAPVRVERRSFLMHVDYVAGILAMCALIASLLTLTMIVVSFS